jgi:polysaccharide pyruvyl transferase WcaK-like protein
LIDALARCDVFYGVGAADFNDFNALGAAYKTWLYRVVRPFVAVSAASAQGFGPLERIDLRRLMARAFDKLDLLSFRDHAFSEQYTRSLGPLSCRSKVTADEALTLPAADAARRSDYLRSAGLAEGEEFVAVHWRATDYTQETDKFYSRVAAAFDAAAEETGLRLVFFPMSYDVHSRHDDACYGAVRDQMASPQSLLMAPVVKDVGLVKAGIGAARFTLGLSYHVHVFALSQGKPALILFTGDYYRYKSHGLVDFYGPPCRAVDLAQASPDELRGAVRTVNAQHADAGRHIEAVNRQLLAVNDWTMCEIARLLREKRRLQ